MTGAVEPVVAAVQEEGGDDPGEGTVPGEAHHGVLLVEGGVDPQHDGPGHQTAQGHDQPAGHTRHTVCNVLRLGPDKMIDSSLQSNHQDDEGDCLDREI